MTDGITYLKVPEVDDKNPDMVTFDLIDEAKVKAIASTFHAGRRCTLVQCDDKTYRPFLIEKTKPGWWRITALAVNVWDALPR